MKTEVLLRSIGKINDELIADAESEANTKRKPGWAKLGIMAACLALVLCTGIAANAIRSNATAGTFTMDVNPSVEYTIAKSGIVKNVRCLNSDAENALSDVALGKQSVETALTRTVAAYEACGYMENGEATVLISFDSRLDANAELKASLSAKIRKALEQTDAVGTLVFHSELTGSLPQQIKPGCPRTRSPACRWTSSLNSKRSPAFLLSVYRSSSPWRKQRRLH